jgi:carbonic anhydrase/acetyltransferase-like protein (isoleucine patch superfamily)
MSCRPWSGGDVIVGHAAMLEGRAVEDGAVVGMGAIVLQRARVGTRSVLAAGAVLSERRKISPGMLAAGVPAVEQKPLSLRRRPGARPPPPNIGRIATPNLTTSVVIEGS